MKDLFFNNLVDQLELGKIVDNPVQVTGGLTHKMFKLITDKGRYIIKILNPNIMKRNTAMENFYKAELYEEVLKQSDIKAVYALIFNGRKMQEIDGKYCYIYEWYDGKILSSKEITKYHCTEMGKVLARIHSIDLVNKEYTDDEKHIDFKYYIDLAREKEPLIYELLYDKLEMLKRSMAKGNEAIKKLPNYFSLCHNDMDAKNVMWLNDDYRLIDLECLGYSNPYLELYELALCWSGYEVCDINFDLFKIFMKTYFDNIKLDKNIDWESIYYANNGRLEWLEYNLKRALMIECDTKEEQELGIKEVKETIEHVVYYDEIKDKILNIIECL